MEADTSAGTTVRVQQVYECNICTKKYVNRQNLHRHTRVKHLNLKYSCRWCESKYTSKTNLTRHLTMSKGSCPEKELNEKTNSTDILALAIQQADLSHEFNSELIQTNQQPAEFTHEFNIELTQTNQQPAEVPQTGETLPLLAGNCQSKIPNLQNHDIHGIL